MSEEPMTATERALRDEPPMSAMSLLRSTPEGREVVRRYEEALTAMLDEMMRSYARLMVDLVAEAKRQS